MSDELHWGGINIKSLLKAVIPDIWMVIAVMIITYLCLGAVGSIRNTPSYTSNAVVAVYPFNKMYTLEASSDALGTVSAVNEVLNSEMFRTVLNDRLSEPADFSSRQIDRTYILMLSATAASPENAYQTLQTALDYYDEISSHLVGDCHLEILSKPDFPLSAYYNSGILKHRLLLTLFMGFAMAGFLALMYAMRKTYKTSTAIRRYYKNVRFFKIPDFVSGKYSLKKKKESDSVPNLEAVRKMALELLQMMRAKSAKSVFVTSAASGEGKSEIIASLAGELAHLGKYVIILETDSENAEIQESVDLESAADIPDQNINVIFTDKYITQDDFSDKEKEVEVILGLTEKHADIVLVDGCIWTGSGAEMSWIEATDVALAICRQDKADFYAIDRMMTDLRENNSAFLGCVLYGF